MSCRLLARPCGEEDVVVDAQRGEEDESEQRQGRVDGREVVDALGQQDAEAQRGEIGGDHRGEQHDRCCERAQERDEDDEHHGERGRDHDQRVAVGRLAQVVFLRGRAPDERPRRGLSRRAAQSRDLSDGSRRVRIALEHHGQQRPRRTGTRLADGRDLRCLPEPPAHVVDRCAVRHEDRSGRRGARREALVEQLLPRHGLHPVGELLLLGQRGVDARQAESEHDEDDRRADPQDARASGDAPGEAGEHAALGVVRRLPGPRDRRPERTPSDEQQSRR